MIRSRSQLCRLEHVVDRYGWSNASGCKLYPLLSAPPSQHAATAQCTLHATHSHCCQATTGLSSLPPSTLHMSTCLAIYGRQELQGCRFIGVIPWLFLVTRTRHASYTSLCILQPAFVMQTSRLRAKLLVVAQDLWSQVKVLGPL